MKYNLNLKILYWYLCNFFILFTLLEHTAKCNALWRWLLFALAWKASPRDQGWRELTAPWAFSAGVASSVSVLKELDWPSGESVEPRSQVRACVSFLAWLWSTRPDSSLSSLANVNLWSKGIGDLTPKHLVLLEVQWDRCDLQNLCLSVQSQIIWFFNCWMISRCIKKSWNSHPNSDLSTPKFLHGAKGNF